MQSTAAKHGPSLILDAKSPHRVDRFRLQSRRVAHVHLRAEKSRDAPPLVVILHGCTQTAAGYDVGAGWSTLAERYGFVLLLPEQTQANNPKACFNWFLPGDTARDRGEALSIRQMMEKTIGAHGVDRSRIFVTGLSAGGAMTATMLAVYPEIFAAGAIIAGLPYGSADNVQQAFESMFEGGRGPRSNGAIGAACIGASRSLAARVGLAWRSRRDCEVDECRRIVQQWSDVHGIDVAPVEDVVDGYPRQVWRRDGVDVIESYTITGMAHGTPLATAKHGGAAGPFMLEAGISSSYHIAKFFGLTGDGARERARAATAREKPIARHWCPTMSKSFPTSALRF